MVCLGIGIGIGIAFFLVFLFGVLLVAFDRSLLWCTVVWCGGVVEIVRYSTPYKKSTYSTVIIHSVCNISSELL